MPLTSPGIFFILAMLAGCLAWPRVAWAQVAPTPGLEQRTFNSVQGTCAGLMNNPPPAGTPADDLLMRCTEIGDGSLGIDGTNAALRQVVADEIPSLGAEAFDIVDVQIANVTNRLIALRGGASGISFAGLTIQGESGDFEGRVIDGLLREASASGDDSGVASRFGAFLNGTVGFSAFDGSDEETAFDALRYGVTAGVDYRFAESFVAGLAFGYTDTDQEFDRSAGDIEIDSYTGTLYATYTGERFYVDGIFSYTFNDYDTERRLTYLSPDRAARGDPDGDEYDVSLGGGYEFQRGGWSFGPRARIDYRYLKIDSFTETGAMGLNLRYKEQDSDSLTTVLGGEVAYAISTGFGVVTPQLRVDWEHEFLDDARNIKAAFAADPAGVPLVVRTDEPDRDFVNVGVGVSVTLAGGVAAFIDYEAVIGLDDFEDHVGNFGVRWDF